MREGLGGMLRQNWGGFTGAAILLALMAYTWHDETFGARCERAFPGNLHAQERCVFEMAHGKRDYPSQVQPLQ